MMSEFLHHYQEILTDPAHLAVEITLMLLVDVLFLGIIWPFVVRRIRHEHLVIDEEHGVDHDVETIHVSPVVMHSLVQRVAHLEAEVQCLTERAP